MNAESPAVKKILALTLLCIGVNSPAQAPETAAGPSAEKVSPAVVAELRTKATDGDMQAACALARCLRDGNGVDKNASESLAWFRKAAEAGLSRGMVGLGDAYWKGLGVLEDRATAVAWYRKAADLGDAEGMFVLGHAYKFGAGVEGDPKAAFQWFVRAAELEHKHAIRQVALWSRIGHGTPQDFDKALQWNQRGAKLGIVDCMIGLAGLHLTGEGVEASEQRGKEWLEKAAQLGGAKAMDQIADAFSYDTGLLPKDPKRGLEWKQRAAEAGSEIAPFSLGLSYERGEGVPVDHSQAMRWFKFGLDKGHSYCALHYAQGLWAGRGVKQDERLAVELFRRIAESAELEKSKSEYWSHSKHTEAMEVLSTAYYLGKGAPKDVAMAYAWANVAAGYGNTVAEYQRTTLEEFMDPATIKEGQRLSREIAARLREVASGH